MNNITKGAVQPSLNGKKSNIFDVHINTAPITLLAAITLDRQLGTVKYCITAYKGTTLTERKFFSMTNTFRFLM